MVSLYGDDPGVTCHCFAAMSSWWLGYPDQAITDVQQAVAVAKETGNPYCETFALDFVAWIRVLRREEDAAQAAIDALMQIAPEQGFRFLLADSQVLHGWILAARGEAAEGLEWVRSAMAAYESTGALMSRPAQLLLLAKVYGQAGQTDEALRAVAASQTVAAHTGEQTYEAELHRLQGELMLARSKPTGRKRRVAKDAAAAAEACFEKAIEVARRQQAKSLELRAAMSLSRLWQQQGKRRQAHAMLAEIFGWFTEGFETPDLREAESLLAELA